MLIFGQGFPLGIVGDNGFDSLVHGQPVLPGDGGGSMSSKANIFVAIS